MGWTRPVVSLVALVAATHGVAWACTCVPEPLDVLVDQSDLVVHGEILSVRGPIRLGCGSSLDSMNVRVEVLEAFVGAEAGEVVTVHTTRSSASCGVGFAEGDRWLVIAQGGQAWLCGGSEPAEVGDSVLDRVREM